MISRRQFLRACMYAAPAAIVAPKAISYFLPPRIQTFDWVDYGSGQVEDYFAEYSKAARELRELILRTIGEAPKEFAVAPERYVKILDGALKSGLPMYADRDLTDKTHFLLMGVPVVIAPELAETNTVVLARV